MGLKRTFTIVGSRTYPVQKDWWDNVLDDEGRGNVVKDGRAIVAGFMAQLVGDVTVVSGGAAGPDTWAIEIAKEMGFQTVEIRPNWKKYGQGAGFKRNTELVDLADDVIAFWDLESNGTFDTIKKAAKAEKDLIVFGPDAAPFIWFTRDDYLGKTPDYIKKVQELAAKKKT